MSYEKGSVDYTKIKFKRTDPKKLKALKKDSDEGTSEDYMISLSDYQPSSKDVKESTDYSIMMAKDDYDDLSETYLKNIKGKRLLMIFHSMILL